MQQVRTSVGGRVANSTTPPFSGQIGINVLDGRAFSTNGTNYFEIGGNVATSNVSVSLNVAAGMTANSTLVNAAAINIISQVNTATFFATTTANVGANVSLTAANLVIFNTTAVGNLVLSAQIFSMGNSTVFTSGNSTTESWIGTTSNVVINTSAIVIANGSLQSSLMVVAATKTSNYTLTNTDSGTMIPASNTTSMTITVPATMTPNSRVLITRLGTGNVVIGNAAGMTLGSRTGAYTVANQYGSATIFVVNSSLTIVDGNI